ncbi:MAG: phosphatase PAP2 family protein [Ignavibacteriales bacterium]
MSPGVSQAAMDPTAATVDVPARARESRARPLAHAVLAEVRRDAPLLLVVATYTAIVGGLCDALDRPTFFHPWVYMSAWTIGLVALLGAYVVVRELPHAVRANPRRPLRTLAARLKPHVTPRFWAGVVLFMASGLFTGTFTSAKSLMSEALPFRSDALLAKLDAALFMGVDPWRVLQPVLGHPLVTRAIQNVYLCGWTALLIVLLGAVTFWPRLTHVRTRFYVIYFGAWIVLGNILAAVFLSGGPAYYAALTGDHARFGPLMQYLSFSDGALNSSVTLQHKLWAMYLGHHMEMGSGISAFPSLHVAMTTLFALTAFHIDRRLGWLMSALAGVIFVGSVHLAWHYAVDGLFSGAFVTAAWFGMAALKPKPSAGEADRGWGIASQ